MDLPELREQIDNLDDELLRLLSRRAQLALEIGEAKRKAGRTVYAPEREEELLRSLERRNAGRMPGGAVRAIFREIMSASLALEKGLTIAYFGPEATWTHQAARAKFGASVCYVAQPSIPDVFFEVARGRADYGVVPIENSTEGAVSHTLDVFIDSELMICSQVLLKIEHCLASNGSMESIKRIYSHPQAFGQCRQWLCHHLPHAELVEVSSTTRAAELSAKSPGSAAICGVMGAQIHGLHTLQVSIQDNSTNTTRFLVLGHEDCPPTGDDKTSLMFGLQDRAGALHDVLDAFARRQVNMSKIESRPSRRRAWEYFFFADVTGHRNDPPLREAFDELAANSSYLKILGSYPNTREES